MRRLQVGILRWKKMPASRCGEVCITSEQHTISAMHRNLTFARPVPTELFTYDLSPTTTRSRVSPLTNLNTVDLDEQKYLGLGAPPNAPARVTTSLVKFPE